MQKPRVLLACVPFVEIQMKGNVVQFRNSIQQYKRELFGKQQKSTKTI